MSAPPQSGSAAADLNSIFGSSEANAAANTNPFGDAPPVESSSGFGGAPFGEPEPQKVVTKVTNFGAEASAKDVESYTS